MAEYILEIQDDFKLASSPEVVNYGGFWVRRSKSIIYMVTNKPDNYWAGDIGTVTFPEGYGATPYGEYGYGDESEIVYDIFPISSDDESITLSENLLYEPPQDSIVFISKDNIKKDSFSYRKRLESEKTNRVRVNYINREEDYIKDIIEAEDVFDIESSGEVREAVFGMEGIKRQSQARRMTAFLLDYGCYVDWECNFETDIIGMFLCIGNIVGVSHPTTNWIGKLFRIIEISEIQDFEVGLVLTEYLPDVYHDEATPYNESFNYESHKFDIPGQVNNLALYEDRTKSVYYIAFSPPDEPPDFYIGALLYKQTDTGLWECFGPDYSSTSSVKLDVDMTASDTSLFFDVNYVKGTWPDSGYIWCESEMMYFDGINETTGELQNLQRGVNDSIAAAHVGALPVILFSESLLSIPFNSSDIAKTFNWKAIAITSYNITSDEDLAPEASIIIQGYYYWPLPVGNPKIQLI